MTNAEAYIKLWNIKRTGKELSQDVFAFVSETLLELSRRDKGCVWCEDNAGGKYLTKTMQYNYCPKCGRRLR